MSSPWLGLASSTRAGGPWNSAPDSSSGSATISATERFSPSGSLNTTISCISAGESFSSTSFVPGAPVVGERRSPENRATPPHPAGWHPCPHGCARSPLPGVADHTLGQQRVDALLAQAELRQDLAGLAPHHDRAVAQHAGRLRQVDE